MMSTVLWCCALLVAGHEGDQPSAPLALADREAYESAAAKAGRDPDAQVRLVLWCEAHGLSAGRIKHLGLAVLSDPTNVLARGLLGLVAYQGKWQRPDEISKAVQDDPERKARVQDYLQRRARTPERAEDHQKLALWCEQNGLKDQAIAHFHQALRLDPSREVAWKHLGYKKVGGRWQKPELVDAQKHEAEQQRRANKHWKPLLERWREGLASKDKARHAAALKGLAEVTDPRAVPAVWTTFAAGAVERQKVAVRVLGQIDSPGASRALAMLALSSPSAEVRQHASRTLTRRNPRNFAPFLVGLFRDPIKYEVKKVKGPGSHGELLVKNKDANVKRIYTPLEMPTVSMLPSDRMGVDANGQPVIFRPISQFSMPITPAAAADLMFGTGGPAVPSQLANVLHKAGLPLVQSQALDQMAQNQNAFAQAAHAMFTNYGRGGPGRGIYVWNFGLQLQVPLGAMMQDAQRSAQVAEQQLESDVHAIQDYNSPIDESNKRVRQVLSDSVGVDVGEDRVAWEKWLVDLLGFAYAPQLVADSQPTIVQQVPLSYQPQAMPVVQSNANVNVFYMQHSCFGAGTRVRTIDGLRPIESLRIGDQVLTQNPKTGALKYQAVVTVFHNPPNATLRIELDNDSIVLTGIHRLWKAGQGWVMARELKAGDTLRTLGGTAEIKSIVEERKQPVFNLHVADGESFFVGPTGVLAHDNSLINPTPDPFDAFTLAGKRTKP